MATLTACKYFSVRIALTGLWGALATRPVTSPVRHQMSLRFVDGRPISAITTQFLEWICTRLQKQGKRSWLLIWDNASWHYSKQVRTWIREHNQKVKQRTKECAFCPFFCRRKVRGSIQSSPSGYTRR